MTASTITKTINHSFGQILSIKKLGRVEAPASTSASQLLPMDVYYLEYWSAAAGGSRIAAKLFVPVGDSPTSGWPLTTWCHGLGDPAADFRRWPFVEDQDWQKTRGYLAGRWAHYGYATFMPWLPGAGPSEPLMSFSPFSLERNAQAVADGLLALRQLSTLAEFRSVAAEIKSDTESKIELNYEQQVMRSDCVSTPLLVYLAANLQKWESTQNIKALVADDFQPSVAYNATYLGPYLLQLTGKMAAAMRCIWSRTTWALAKAENWPLEDFFTTEAIALFSQQIPTAVGNRDRIFATSLVPPTRSELAIHLEAAVTATVGRTPTGQDFQDWTLTPAMHDWMNAGSLQATVNAPFYQRYYAPSDPFFAENIEPFDPGIPLIVTARAGTTAVNTGGLPSFDERYKNMTLPKLHTLDSWGWQVELVKSESKSETSFSGGRSQAIVLNRLEEILGETIKTIVS